MAAAVVVVLELRLPQLLSPRAAGLVEVVHTMSEFLKHQTSESLRISTSERQAQQERQEQQEQQAATAELAATPPSARSFAYLLEAEVEVAAVLSLAQLRAAVAVAAEAAAEPLQQAQRRESLACLLARWLMSAAQARPEQSRS